MTNDTYPVYKKGIDPKFPALIIIILILCICLATCISCTSVKKVQHSIKETFKLETAKSKDSGATVVKESTTKAKESEEASKVITIEFNSPDSGLGNLGMGDGTINNLPVVASDYVGVDSINYDYANLYISGKTRLITNNRAKVRIKPSGEIELSENPKSITIKENSSKQRSDSSNTKETATVQTKEKESGTVTIEKKETARNKSKWSFNPWWLLLLIPIAYLLNRKFKWI